MSSVIGYDDVKLMAEYDFESPINATVFLTYDSDEDIKPSTEIDTNNTNDIVSIVDNISKDTCKATSKNKNETKATCVTNRPLNNSKKEKKKTYKNKTKGQTLQKISEPGFQYQEKNIVNPNKANLNCDKTIPREDQSTNGNQIATTSLQGSPLGSEPQPLPRNQDSDINKKADECVQSLLNIVSDHMIFIMKAYIDYFAFTKTTADRTMLESAKKQLQRTKFKFFYMSFSPVANIMLSKENDRTFMQNFIDNTIKIGQTKNLYFKHRDMLRLCEEIFDWVKIHSQHPSKAELLSKEPSKSTATSSNTSSFREHLTSGKANNELNSRCCIFSEPTSKESTIDVSSSGFQNPYVQNMRLGQSAQPSGELTTNANTTDYLRNNLVQNALSTQNAPTASVEMRTKANATNYTGYFPVQNTSSIPSLPTPNVEIRTTANTTNYISYNPVQNVPSTEPPPNSELRAILNSKNYLYNRPVQNAPLMSSVPSTKLRVNTNFTKYKSHYPYPSLRPANSTDYLNYYAEQNVAPRLPLPREQVNSNVISSKHTSQDYVQNVTLRQEAPPAGYELRTNANSSNTISLEQHSMQRQSVQPLHINELRKNAISTNYIQEFENFNSSHSSEHPFSVNNSKLHQSTNVQAQRETHHHSTYSPYTSRPPPSYYSTQTRHHDTVTPQSYSQKQYLNVTHCDNIQVTQESVEVNRSLSRDSGFMSPSTCAPQDPMCLPTDDQMDSSSMLSPMITHVTSLNPSASYIEDGICHVCGKLTKDKCLGCLKSYYCSHQCQIDDWKDHVSICNT